MKTIKEKAKAYDKVRKKIAIRFGSNVADEFFAEFEGSKDEEIRKALLEMVHDTTGDELWVDYGVHKEEALAWLEKQGQVKESHVPQHENKTCEENGNSLTSEDEKVRKEIINYFRCQSEEEPTRKEIHNKWIAWLENIPYTIDHEKREGFHLGYRACLEKQGEQKSADSYCQENCKGFQETGKCFADGECKAKREAEQKPADTVEPKFKDGDVLTGKVDGDNYILIFRQVKDGWVETHGHYYDSVNRFCVPSQLFCRDYQGSFTPATKEQRDLLFQKMKEAGYEWDAEKKELKKPEENKGNIGGISANSKWSEEDEKKLLCICAWIKDYPRIADFTDEMYTVANNYIDWLKSLKDRVGCEANCTTTKEWSEDDKRKIDRIYSILRQAADTHAFSTSCRLIGDKECMELQDWLKSLRPQNQWKPSELQLGCLSDAIEYYNSSGYPAPKLKELYEQLKKLKGGKV